ncbi:MAG: hypothetical protein OWU33_03385 [Firmicutes bacterium]|nr:hypothetical protein [Bacillota bacterium]
MGWERMAVESLVAFFGILVYQHLWPAFPHFPIVQVAIVSLAVALVAYALTEMPGGYASHYGRAVLAWIAGVAVMSMFFTTLPRYNGHPYIDLQSAIAVGILIGLTELLVGPRTAEVHKGHE